jgi:phosphatidylglycerophosphate synthase
MLDARARQVLAPTLDRAAARLAAAGVPALAITGVGWLSGVAACVAVGTEHWVLGLVLWLLNRLLDGLDGPVARVRGATDLGGFLDIVADFSIYAGFVVAVAVAVPGARLACAVLLTAYYVSGTAFLALSSLIERRGGTVGDERSLRFVGGLAEGTETVMVYVLFCLLPEYAALVAWLFAGVVAFTAVQRVYFGVRILRAPSPATVPAIGPPPTRTVSPSPPFPSRQEYR